MKAVLYAVKQGDDWIFRTSIEFSVDWNFWFRRDSGVSCMVWFEPQLSFGQAAMLQQDLGAMACRGLSREALAAKAASRDSFRSLPASLLKRLRWYSRERGAGVTESRRIGQAGDKLPTPGQVEELLKPLKGRSLLPEELQSLWSGRGLDKTAGEWKRIVQYAWLLGLLQWEAGTEEIPSRSIFRWKGAAKHRCGRCHSERLNWTECSVCGTLCPYCEECLTMGRVRRCTPLFHVPDPSPEAAGGNEAVQLPDILEPWGLSPAQKAASAEAIRFLADPSPRGPKREPPGFLIWAVTGAGKTEMIFPLIEYALRRGGRICVATPRRDVVLELQPRIAKVFPSRNVVTLYGGSEQRWEQGEITLATTHQLLRFRGSFDLIIIDELDAFPFHNNPVLEHAARKACRPSGRYIFLSATPPAHLQKAARSGRLPHAKVPVRFHRHPLPVPVLVKSRPVSSMLADGRIPQALLGELRNSLGRGAQIFVFVPAIRLADPLVGLLRRRFPETVIQGTSSRDPERTRKVQDFRDGRTRILVTTTILERGVTVPKTDVFILDAGSALFDEAALVQMAGRAGRSLNDPGGRVFFADPEKSASQAGAIRQIREMNRLAAKHGYLQVSSGGE
jgi:competence protein ComFA